jgi:hypothetical protein
MGFDVFETGQVDGAALVHITQTDDEVETRWPAQFVPKEGARAAPVDTTDDFTDQVAVEKRRLTVRGARGPFGPLGCQQCAQRVPVVEDVGWRRSLERDDAGLV